MRAPAVGRHRLAARVDSPAGESMDDRGVASDFAVATEKNAEARWLLNKWEILGVGLTGVGVLLLLFLVYLYAFTPLTGIRDQHRMLQSLTGQPKAVFSLTSGRLPAQGRPVALLTIPTLGEKEVVVNGTDAADLQEGPGLVAKTALPGTPGNAVIAGRRVTYGAPFAKLDDLAPGDPIRVVDGAGKFTFRVVGSQVVSLGGRDRVGHSGDAWLTLVTSNSSLRPSGEVAVLARLVGRPALNGGTSERGAPSVRLSLSGDAAAGLRALLWALAFLVVLAGTLLAIRRWHQPLVTYLLVAPVLLAIGLFTCGSLAQCLPATL